MVAHEKALEWQELFDLAARKNTSQEEIVAMGYRVAGESIRCTFCLLEFTTTRGFVDEKKIFGKCPRTTRLLEKPSRSG
jgi:hypothetical protein